MSRSRKGSHDSDVDRLQAVLSAILDEAKGNPRFAGRLVDAFERTGSADASAGTSDATDSPKVARPHRRAKSVIDARAIWASGGESALRDELGHLDLEQLKDIIAEHGMDRSKLAMKWRTPGRLVDLIVETIDARARKGEAFMATENTSEGVEQPPTPSRYEP